MLNYIKLQNYKTCENVQFNFTSPLMALIGKTGAGKTNILSGIDAAFRFGLDSILPLSHEIDAQKGFAASFGLSLRNVECEYKFEYLEKKNVMIQDSLSVKTGNKHLLLFKKNSDSKLTIFGSNQPIYMASDVSGLALIKNLLLEDQTADYLRGLSNYHQLIASVLLEFARVKYFAIHDLNEMGLFMKKDYEKWKASRILSKKDQLLSLKLYDFFITNYDGFSKFKAQLQKLGVIENIEHSELQAKNEFNENFDFIVWRFLIHEKKVPFSWLPNGIKRIISIMLDMHYEKISLLLIAEPEISLHWEILAKFLSFLNEHHSDIKILISTYSEPIIKQLSHNQLLYVVNSSGKTKIKTVKNKEKMKSDQLISDSADISDPQHSAEETKGIGYVSRFLLPGPIRRIFQSN